MRCARRARHFEHLDADYYLILAGDHLYRMDYARTDRVAHRARRRHHDCRAAGDAAGRDRDGHLPVRSRRARSPPSRRSRTPRAWPRSGRSCRQARVSATPAEKPFVASMGIYVFSRQVLLDVLERAGHRLRQGDHPAALARYNVNAFLHRGYWADVGTIGAYYDANLDADAPGRAVPLPRPERPIFTHPRVLPPARFDDCTLRESLIAEGCSLEKARSPNRSSACGCGARRRAISRSVLVGADFYESEDDGACATAAPRLGIGRDVTIDRAISTRTRASATACRLVNEAGSRKPTATAGTSAPASSSCRRRRLSSRGRWCNPRNTMHKAPCERHSPNRSQLLPAADGQCSGCTRMSSSVSVETTGSPSK